MKPGLSPGQSRPGLETACAAAARDKGGPRQLQRQGFSLASAAGDARAVRMVKEHEGEHSSRWATVPSGAIFSCLML